MEHLANIWDSMVIAVLIFEWDGNGKEEKSKLRQIVLLALAFLFNIEVCDYTGVNGVVPIVIDILVILSYGILSGSRRVAARMEAYITYCFLCFVSAAAASLLMEYMRQDGMEGWLNPESSGRALYLSIDKLLMTLGAAVFFAVNRLFLFSEKIMRGKRVSKSLFLWTHIVLPIASCMVCFQLMDLSYYVKEGMSRKRILFVYFVVMMFMISLAALSAVSLKLETDRLKHEKMKELFRQEKKHFYEIIEYEKRANKFRHDLKNRMLGIEYLLEGGDEKQGLGKLKELVREFHALDYNFDKNQSIWNIIIESKFRNERLEDIEVTKNIELDSLGSVDEVDFGVLLGNLLDNAITAARNSKERKVRIDLMAEKGYIFLEVTNSCPLGENRQEAVEKSLEHGFGLISIKEIVNRYHGTYTTGLEEKIYKASILIPNSGPAD